MALNREENETKGIKATLIIEILGRPPEHLAETLKKISDAIKEERGVVIEEVNIKEPVELQNQKGFYSSFAEITIEVKEITTLAILMFKYMPAHVEVIYPELIALTNNGWSDILSEIIRRLHGYDEVARILQMEKKILENKLREALGEKGEAEIKKDKEKKPKTKKKIKKSK